MNSGFSLSVSTGMYTGQVYNFLTESETAEDSKNGLLKTLLSKQWFFIRFVCIDSVYKFVLEAQMVLMPSN